MYTFGFLWLLTVITQNVEPAVVCDGVIFHGEYYDKKLLFEGMGKVYNLLLHKFSGCIFFSHLLKNASKVDFEIKVCHLEKKTCKQVTGLSGGYAIGYDRRYDDIYFGGHSGLYKYNFRTKSADYFGEKTNSIWAIMIEKHFYYVEYPTQKLYVYTRGSFEKVPSTFNIEIDKFYISRHQIIYYSNSSGLFKIDKDFHTPVLLKSKFQVRQITEDMYGDVYFCTHDGIYMELRSSNRIKKVASIDQVYSITFINSFTPLKDDLIYTDIKGIYKLQESNYKQLCLRALEEEKKQQLKNSVVLNELIL